MKLFRPREPKDIEVQLKHPGIRLAIVIALFVFGIGMIIYGGIQILERDQGWQEIKQNDSSPDSAASEITFMYCLEGKSVRADYRELTLQYTDAAAKYYKIFAPRNRYDGVANLALLNQNPNTEQTIEPELYRALELIEQYGSREIFLAPLYETYDGVFRSVDDPEAAYSDPLSSENAPYLAEAISFAKDPKHVSLRLLGDNRAMLCVSEEYLSFMRETESDTYLDFYYLKNAFILDLLTEKFTSLGYTRGFFQSSDGYISCLDQSGELFSLPITDRVGYDIYPAADLSYKGPMRFVLFRNYGITDTLSDYYYRFEDGRFLSPYLSSSDGTNQTAVNDLVVYGKGSVSELLLKALPIYIADSLDEAKLSALSKESVYAVYTKNREIRYTEPDAEFLSVYSENGIEYSLKKIG